MGEGRGKGIGGGGKEGGRGKSCREIVGEGEGGKRI